MTTRIWLLSVFQLLEIKGVLTCTIRSWTNLKMMLLPAPERLRNLVIRLLRLKKQKQYLTMVLPNRI